MNVYATKLATSARAYSVLERVDVALFNPCVITLITL